MTSVRDRVISSSIARRGLLTPSDTEWFQALTAPVAS